MVFFIETILTSNALRQNCAHTHTQRKEQVYFLGMNKSFRFVCSSVYFLERGARGPSNIYARLNIYNSHLVSWQSVATKNTHAHTSENCRARSRFDDYTHTLWSSRIIHCDCTHTDTHTDTDTRLRRFRRIYFPCTRARECDTFRTVCVCLCARACLEYLISTYFASALLCMCV